jgi:hypothetical protein
MLTDGLGNLGFYSLAALYGCCGLGSLVSTAIVKKLGIKINLFFGGIGTTFWVFSTIFAAIKSESDENDSFYV